MKRCGKCSTRIWPMQKSTKMDGITYHTDCYTNWNVNATEEEFLELMKEVLTLPPEQGIKLLKESEFGALAQRQRKQLMKALSKNKANEELLTKVARHLWDSVMNE